MCSTYHEGAIRPANKVRHHRGNPVATLHKRAEAVPDLDVFGRQKFETILQLYCPQRARWQWS